MGKIFKNQTALKLIANVKQDVTGALATKIKYKKPDTSLGSFNASVTNASSGTLQYSVTSSGDIDQAGEWRFWGHVTFSDSNYAAGEVFKKDVYEEGNA